MNTYTCCSLVKGRGGIDGDLSNLSIHCLYPNMGSWFEDRELPNIAEPASKSVACQAETFQVSDSLTIVDDGNRLRFWCTWKNTYVVIGLVNGNHRFSHEDHGISLYFFPPKPIN